MAKNRKEKVSSRNDHRNELAKELKEAEHRVQELKKQINANCEQEEHQTDSGVENGKSIVRKTVVEEVKRNTNKQTSPKKQFLFTYGGNFYEVLSPRRSRNGEKVYKPIEYHRNYTAYHWARA